MRRHLFFTCGALSGFCGLAAFSPNAKGIHTGRRAAVGAKVEGVEPVRSPPPAQAETPRAVLLRQCRAFAKNAPETEDEERWAFFGQMVAQLDTADLLELLQETWDSPRAVYTGLRLMAEYTARDSAAAKAWIEKCPPGGRSYRRLWFGYLRGMARTDFAAATALAGTLGREHGLDAALCRTQMFTELAERDPRAAWEQVLLDKDVSQDDRERVAGYLAAEDPELLKQWMTGEPPPKFRPGFLVRVFQAMAATRPEEIYHLIPASGEIRGQALTALAGTTLSADPRECLTALGEVSASEKKDFLAKWSSTHPTAALELVDSTPELRAPLLEGLTKWPASLQRPDAARAAWDRMDAAEKIPAAGDMAYSLSAIDFAGYQKWLATVPEKARAGAIEKGVSGGFGHHREEVMAYVENQPKGADFAVGVQAAAAAWGRTEPNSAANWLLNLDEPSVLAPGLERVLPHWNKLDPAGMVEWISAANLAAPETVKLLEPFAAAPAVAEYLARPEIAKFRPSPP